MKASLGEMYDRGTIRDILGVIPRGDRWPGHMGISLVANGRPLLVKEGVPRFMADDDSYWVGLTFIPMKNWRDRRDVLRVSRLATKFVNGLPVVGNEADGFDLFAGGDDPQASSVATRLAWSLLGAGFAVRQHALPGKPSWRQLQPQFLSYLADEDGNHNYARRCYQDRDGDGGVIPLGGTMYGTAVLGRRDWAPVPLVRFDGMDADNVFRKLAVVDGCPDGTLPRGLFEGFLAFVRGGCEVTSPFGGRVVGIDEYQPSRRPKTLRVWAKTTEGRRMVELSGRAELLVEPGSDVTVGQRIAVEPYGDCIKDVRSLTASELAGRLRQRLTTGGFAEAAGRWFASAAFELKPNGRHVPLPLVNPLIGQTNPDEMVWDVRHCGEFWCPEAEGFCFPPVGHWPVTCYKTNLPGSWVGLDLTPGDPRFIPPAAAS